MKKIIHLDDFESDVIELEGLYYQTKGYENILGFMLMNSMTGSEEYQKYWNQYLDILRKYEDCKAEKSEKFISVSNIQKELPQNYNWNIIFRKREMVIQW